MLHYFDDFFIVFSLNTNFESRKIEWKFFCLFLDLFINEKKKKFDIKLNFLDIKLNTLTIKTRFFEKKLSKIKNLIAVVLQKNHFLRHDLEKLIDFLIFCVKIIVFNRFFFILFYKTFDREVFYYNIIKSMRDDFFW